MGRNVSATLAFGVDLGYDAPFNSGTEDDPDTGLGEYLALRSSAVNPWDEVPRDVLNGPYADFKAWEASNPAWKKRQCEWAELKNQLENAAPVEVDYYGTAYGESYYVLILKDSKQEADWSEPTRVQVNNIGPEGGVTEKRVRKAVEWCEFNGLPSFEDAAWILYAMEG